MKDRVIRALLGASLTAALPVAAAAQTCTVAATPVAFGAYDPFSPSPKDTTGSVTVRCRALLSISILVSYSVGLTAGGGGSYAGRRLARSDGAHSLAYQLYSDAGRTQVWGDGTGGTGVMTQRYLLDIFLLERTDDSPLYGRIPARQSAAPGAYGDVIVVTLTY